MKMCFAIDESGSVGSDNFQTLKTLVKDIASKVDTKWAADGVTGNQYSAVTFDQNSVQVAELQGLTEFVDDVDAAPYDGGWTGQSEGIRLCHEMLGNDTTEAKLLVMLTDGKPTRCCHPAWDDCKKDGQCREEAVHQATSAKNFNIDVLSIWLGKDPGSDEEKFMKEIKSDKFRVYAVGFDDASKIVDDVTTDLTCGGNNPSSPSVTNS